ncbi:MAG: PIN domain-containing protein [Candidatus Saccharimonadales bacterium]
MSAKTTLIKAFFDTNVLVYQFDKSAPLKQKQAKTLIKQALQTGHGVISSQVAQEFLNVATSKFASKIPALLLGNVLSDMLLPLLALSPSADFYERALGLFTTNKLSFYDALIIQAAIDLKCDVLYSEDLQTGRKFESVLIQNPFE